MIAGEDDDGVLLQRRGVERIQNLPDVIVHGGNAREVGLDELLQGQLPIIAKRSHQTVVNLSAAIIAIFDERVLERVLRVPGFDLGQLQLFQWKEVKIFLRHDQRRMRTDESHAHEEGLRLGFRPQFAQLGHGPLRVHFIGRQIAVRVGCVAHRSLALPTARHPGEAAALQIPQRAERAVDGAKVIPKRRGRVRVGDLFFVLLRKGAVIRGIPVLLPLLAVAVVHDLARAECLITLRPELIHQRAVVFQDLIFIPVVHAKVPRGVRIKPGEETRAGRRADRHIAVRLGKRDTTGE